MRSRSTTPSSAPSTASRIRGDMRASPRFESLVLWLAIPALGLLWVSSIYVSDRACALHSPYVTWCGVSTVAVIAVPLFIAGMVGFILGKRFGKHETTRRVEHEFD